jgi:hypothetical protein
MSMATDVVDAQIVAYQAKDVERFLSYYADDASVVLFDGTPMFAGKQTMREQYGKLSADSPDLDLTIASRVTAGNSWSTTSVSGVNFGDVPTEMTALSAYPVIEHRQANAPVLTSAGELDSAERRLRCLLTAQIRLRAQDATHVVAAIGVPITRLCLPAPPIRRLNETWDPDAAGHQYRCPGLGAPWHRWRDRDAGDAGPGAGPGTGLAWMPPQVAAGVGIPVLGAVAGAESVQLADLRPGLPARARFIITSMRPWRWPGSRGRRAGDGPPGEPRGLAGPGRDHSGSVTHCQPRVWSWTGRTRNAPAASDSSARTRMSWR